MLPWQRLREFEVGKTQSLQIIFDYRHIARSHSRQGFVGSDTPRMYKCLFLWPVSTLVGFLLLTFRKTILLKCSPKGKNAVWKPLLVLLVKDFPWHQRQAKTKRV